MRDFFGVGHLARVWLVRLLSQILAHLDFFLDSTLKRTVFRGSAKVRREAERSGKSAHVVKVLSSANHFDFTERDLNNFVCLHSSYEEPEFVLRHDVYLWFIREKCAVFCKTDPRANVHDTKKYPFYFTGLDQEVRELVLLPVDDFVKLGDAMGNPKCKLLVVHMTIRCGSTLLAQSLSRLPNCRSVSEPEAFQNVARMYGEGKITSETRTALVRSALRMHCRPGPDISGGDDPDSIVVIKLPPFSANEVPLMKEQVPGCVLVFNTRHPRTTLPSQFRMIEHFLDSASGRLGYYYQWILDHVFYQLTDQDDGRARRRRRLKAALRDPGIAEISAAGYGVNLAAYLANAARYAGVVTYEDLSARPKETVDGLLRLLSVPSARAGAALEAFSGDSQNGAFGERGKAVRNKVTPDVLRRADKVLEALDIPIRCDMSVADFRRKLCPDKLLVGEAEA